MAMNLTQRALFAPGPPQFDGGLGPPPWVGAVLVIVCMLVGLILSFTG
jgi:hypothetical protein